MLNRSFNGFRGTFVILHAYYSTSAASKEGIELLVKSAGFSEDEAASIVTNPKVGHLFKSTKTPQLVVDFFKNNGFGEIHIRKVITTIPRVLRSDVEKTLKPKIRVLQELGISGSDLGFFLSHDPYVLLRSLNAYIVPSLELLKSVLGGNEQLIRVLLQTKSLQLLSSHVLKNVPHNLALLQSFGFPKERIQLFIAQFPQFLAQRTKEFEKNLKRVEEKLGIPPTTPMFLYGLGVLLWITDDKLKSFFELFQTYGWGKPEITILLRKQPLILNFSEQALRAKLKYLMQDLGYGSDYLATRHVLLSLSLEKRIVPRNVLIQALKEKRQLKFDLSFYTVMKLAESQFVKTYVQPYKDDFPELYENYTRATGGAQTKI